VERNDTAIQIVFLSWLAPDYSRSAVILNSRYAEKFSGQFRKVKSGVSLPITLIRVVLDFHKKNVIYFVCSPCLTISLWLKLFGRKRIFLDAGWPLTDNTYKSNNKILNFFKKLRIRLIEWLAFRASHLIFLESVEQANRVSLDFKLDPKKIVVGYTGLNEHEFEVDSIEPHELIGTSFKSTGPIILFRGKINEESGLDKIQDLISNLGNTTFIICSSNLPRDFPYYDNLIRIERNVSIAEMKYLYQISDVALGQLGTSNRLTRTIPHKAFESAYFGKPYLGFNHKALNELFNEKQSSLLFTSLDELQNLLSNYKQYQEAVKDIGLNAKRIYEKDFSQENLSQKCIDRMIKYTQES
jgi:glycosyltransferase involved in cell wall biosynthesis